MAKFYRRKLTAFEAQQWISVEETPIRGNPFFKEAHLQFGIGPDPLLYTKTEIVVVLSGDWVVKMSNEGFCVYKPAEFERIFEEVEAKTACGTGWITRA